MRKPITFFIPSLAGGGVQRVVINLTGELSARGMEIDLVVGNASGPFIDFIPYGVRLIDLHQKRISKSILPFMQYLNTSRPSIVFSAQTHTNIVSAIAVKSSISKSRLVLTEHNNMLAVIKHSGNSLDAFRSIGARLFYPFADKIVAVSQGVADSLCIAANLPKSKILVIYNPLVTPEIEKLSSQPCVHPWLLQSDIPVILSVGRLTPQKNFPLLLKAFTKVKERLGAKLIILGEGNERNYLAQLITKLDIQKDVDLPGYVINPYSYMKRASLFVLSSAWEGFPSVLVEAMACGLNIVSTNCQSGPIEILKNGEFGRLVPVNQVDKMADAIIIGLQDPLPAHKLIDHSLSYSVSHSSDQYQELISQLTNSIE